MKIYKNIDSIYHFGERIQRIIAYIPILWKVFDFDWSSILIILKFQLSRVRRSIEKGYHSKRSIRRDSKRIRTCELLIDRILADSYIDKEYDALSAKYKHLRGEFGLNWREGISEKVQKEYHDQFLILSTKENMMQKQDLDLLGKYFSKYLRCWWS